MGCSPYQYVLRCRVERAKRLLLQRKLSIADVALTVGFSSQSHLTQHFRRHVGTTPKRFLKQ
ncbi:helix-turn-helix transcriptional regulator [Adonisia turfae]|uniref:helix-turn-helix transcriptional regulator n=1 Tax=Adonisia turfae TaxID=2950184 RepID=UPI002029A055|nr:helix-turn-helix transcriptional regulator [Adonisia turfae]